MKFECLTEFDPALYWIRTQRPSGFGSVIYSRKTYPDPDVLIVVKLQKRINQLINLKVYSILFLAPFGILNKGTDNEHFFNNSKINIKKLLKIKQIKKGSGSVFIFWARSG